MITPGIEICDLDGNPISGALVNQEVKALLSFAVTGKTEIETTCTPVFDLKGAYYTESADKGLPGRRGTWKCCIQQR